MSVGEVATISIVAALPSHPMSETFRLVETGSDPRSHPTLDYSLVLPFLLSRYTLEEIPFLANFSETSTVLKYLQVDFDLVQRQVREELHLEKQQIGPTRVSARALEFERGSAEDRARIVLSEIERLGAGWASHQEHHVGMRTPFQPLSSLLSNTMYRAELTTLLSVISLKCRSPPIDFEALIHTLSLVRDPSIFMTALAANNPHNFFAMVDLVVRYDPMGSTKAILYALCRLAPHHVWEVRQLLLKEKAFPNLAIQLTIEICHDEVNFMNRLLRGKPEWLTQKDPITPQSINSVMDLLFASLLEEQAAPTSRPDKVCQLHRILSGMTGLLGVTLSKEQVSILIDTLDQTPGASTVDLKVCAILMCAAQLVKQAESKLRRILVSLLEQKDSPQVLLMAIYFRTDQLLMIDEFASNILSMDIIVPRNGLIELRRVFLSLFSDHQLATCALALGRKPPVPSSPDPHGLQQQIVHDVVDNQKLSSIATFCVFQLLKDGAFQRSNVDVRQWVLEQIRSTTLPLDENLVPLLRAYTNATSQSDAISRIPEQSIREQFTVPSSSFALGGTASIATLSTMTPAKAILVLYMLMNNEVYLQNLATDNYDKNSEYAGRFLESIHIRKVMLYVMQHEDGIAFKEIQPMFMKLATAQFPEMFDITTLLLEEEAEAAAPQGYGFKKGGSLNKPTHWPSIVRPNSSVTMATTHFNALQNMSTILRQSIERPEAAVTAYHAFQRLSAVEMEQAAETLIYSSLPRLLDPRASPQVLEAFKKTWDKLNGLMSHDLWAMTVNAVRASSTREVSDVICRVGKESEHKTTVLQPSMESSLDMPRTATSVMVDGPFWTYEWLLEDPLLLFRVNARVFRQPVILRIFIQILDAIMVGSRHWLRKLFHASMAISLHGAPSTAGGTGGGTAGGRRTGGGGAVLSSTRPSLPVRTFLEPQLNTLLQLQESSLVQLMLEAIRYTPKEVEENRRKQQQHQQQPQPSHIQADSFDDETHEADQEEQDLIMKEVREIVFNFVHQLFINPKFQFLPKLLHFQGYKKDLIQTVVKGVPSIHVCMDFIQELMNQENEETQRFALRLAAQLCDHLPLPKTYQMANEFILPRLEELLFRTQLTAPEVIKSAAVLCHAFPSLKNTLVQMLEAARGSITGGTMQHRLVGMTIDQMERMAKDRTATDKSVL